jgi:hypothetical protein
MLEELINLTASIKGRRVAIPAEPANSTGKSTGVDAQ